MSKPRPILGEMPWNVKQIIVESTDTKTKISLRPTAKSLKYVVDNSVIQYHGIRLQINEHFSTVSLEVNITARQRTPDFQLEFRTDRAVMNFWISGTFEKELKDGDFIDLLAQKFTKVFRNPHAIVNTLEILDFPTSQDADIMARRELLLSAIGTHLSRLPHKINVECLKISAKDQHQIVPILHNIKPVVLKTINLRSSDLREDFPLDSVAGMEQWKKARCLNVHDLNLMLPEKDTEHFDEVICRMDNFGLEQTKISIETIFNGARKRSIKVKRVDLNAIASYLGQNLSTPDCKQFKISRGSASCNVKLLYSCCSNIAVFYNPEKTSVGHDWDVAASFY